MKVALLLTQDRGGPVDLTVGLALELASRPNGPEVVVIGPEPVTSAGKLSDLLCRHEVHSKTDLAGALGTQRLLNQLRPDIVHGQDRRAALVLSGIGRRPWLYTYHGRPDETGQRWFSDGRYHGRRPTRGLVAQLTADALLARVSSAVATPSIHMVGFLTDTLRVPARRVHHVPNGVAPGPPRRLSGPVRLFASVGSFVPRKAMPLLVEAFARVAATRTDVRLKLIGDGEDRHRCEEAISAAGLGRRVEITGYRTDVRVQLASVDAFVLASIDENLPLALLEALGAGLPCIATRVGGVPEVIGEDGGILVPPGDVDALAKAMGRLADDADLGRVLASRGTARMSSRYTIAHCADAHQRLWQKLLN